MPPSVVKAMRERKLLLEADTILAKFLRVSSLRSWNQYCQFQLLIFWVNFCFGLAVCFLCLGQFVGILNVLLGPGRVD